MNNADSTILGDHCSWICPVCNASGTDKGLFVSDWALACHIAGKARTGDRLHKSWALNKYPSLDFKASILKVAERILWAVRETQREREMAKQSSQNNQRQEPYEKIKQIEIRLHEYIRQTLKAEYGDSEEGWWAKGVPVSVRKKCVERREENVKRQDPYTYTDLIDLQSIMDNNWRLFEASLKRISKECKSKKDLLSSLGKLNEIRKIIMHPVRGGDELSSEDIQFLESLIALTKEFVSSD